MAYFRCQQGSSSGGAGATITVTYDSSFYNKTMTCTNGTKTYTKTTTSSGSTTFNVNEEGTWTITCNGVSRTVNVVLSYSTQMAITKTVTIYGAKEDYITYTDATGSKVCQFASGATSKSVSITFIPNQSIIFTSTVAKNPNNPSANFTKTVTLTKNTTTVDVMPVARSNVIYWYGYDSGILGTLTSYGYNSNGGNASNEGTPVAPSRTYYTNYIHIQQNESGSKYTVGICVFPNKYTIPANKSIKAVIKYARIYTVGKGLGWQYNSFTGIPNIQNQFTITFDQKIVRQQDAPSPIDADVAVENVIKEYVPSSNTQTYLAFYLRSIGTIDISAIYLE